MIEIIPYTEINGTRTLSDDEMRNIFNLMESDGNLNKVFFHGFPSNAYQFMLCAKNPFNKIIIAKEEEKPIILSWITDVIGKKGTIHFCSFNGIYAGKKIEAARIGLKRLLRYYLVLVSLIPEIYTDAIRFAEMVGFKKVGIIPNFSYFPKEEKHTNSWMGYITKELLEV
jgi:hypothetical protein